MMPPITTARLRLRELVLSDAAFMLELLNEPAFIRNIGDRGVRSVAAAEQYLHDGPLASYAQHGFGLWGAEHTTTNELIGICGLLQRPVLPGPDLGYALLTRHAGQGYATEAAQAALAAGEERWGFKQVLAITALENVTSIRLLEKLSFRFLRIEQLPGYPSPSRIFERNV